MSFRITLAGLAIATLFHGAGRADEIDFTRDIRPVLSDACYACHGPDANARATELRLDERGSALKSDVFSSGEMLERLLATDPDTRMPPVDSKRVLTDENRTKLIAWLKAGAQWPEDDRHWAFIPPGRPELPTVKNADWSRNSIDRFVLSRLEKAKLEPSKEVDKATLLRRVTFDLTGLPPTIEELDAFLNDNSDQAYEKVVDRLLASERYGEHMALDWLEASRYADTDGYQNDRLRHVGVAGLADYGTNNNMPFDRFGHRADGPGTCCPTATSTRRSRRALTATTVSIPKAGQFPTSGLSSTSRIVSKRWGPCSLA